MMKIPIVDEGKFILITAEHKTGIILNNDGSRYLGEGDSYYEVVDGKSKAIDRINKVQPREQ